MNFFEVSPLGFFFFKILLKSDLFDDDLLPVIKFHFAFDHYLVELLAIVYF